MSGFTLVEILIVVVILGILAAIVIPQFTNASESAKASSLISQLQTLRSQLELAQIQHQGAYPPLATFWTDLTTETEQLGAYSGAADDGDPSNNVGPYLQQPSVNPFENSSTVAADNTGAWEYDVTTGALRAVMDNAKAIEVGLVPSTHSAGDPHPDILTK